MLKIITGHPISGDVKEIEGDQLRIATDDNRCFVEIRIRKDGKSIELRTVDTCKFDGVVHDNAMVIEPKYSNEVIISTREWSH